jgi:peptidoglycan pentaglycine glycine transferase (the first glycine)
MQNIDSPDHWNSIIASVPRAHLLQTSQWAALKEQVGWQPFYRIWGDQTQPDAATLILLRTISIAGFGPRLRVIYLPKGPLLRDWGDGQLRLEVLNDITSFARQKGAIFLKIDPDVPIGRGIPDTPEGSDDPLGAMVLEDLTNRGFHYSAEQVQFRNTVLLDLNLSEDELLARMKQKTRYNVRLATRRGVTVRQGTKAELDMLYRMYAETSLRDGFAIRERKYYLNLWQTFMTANEQTTSSDQPGCQPLIAEVDGAPVAAVVIFHFAERAYYLHGMSKSIHREKMPTYLLQWEAIKLAQSMGCTVYDFWGAPEVFDPNDSMWGVFRFKEGLGGQVLRTMGAYDLPIRPLYYRLYAQVLPRLLDIMRRRGKVNTEDAIND